MWVAVGVLAQLTLLSDCCMPFTSGNNLEGRVGNWKQCDESGKLRGHGMAGKGRCLTVCLRVVTVLASSLWQDALADRPSLGTAASPNTEQRLHSLICFTVEVISLVELWPCGCMCLFPVFVRQLYVF